MVIFEMIKQIISKFGRTNRQNKPVFEPLKQHLELEIFLDTSMDGDNQQGLLTILRQSGTEKIIVLSWRSRKKRWSINSGEARVLQQAIDKGAHFKALAFELNLIIKKVTILADNLSLSRVIQSCRPTQEQGLRRDIAIIRNQIVHKDLRVRYAKNEAMLADHLTNNRGGEQLYNILKTGGFQSIKDYD